jgi:hypothetical protein
MPTGHASIHCPNRLAGGVARRAYRAAITSGKFVADSPLTSITTSPASG